MSQASRPKARLTREDWIAAGRAALVQSGVQDVKIDRLARKLRVTRGSFYWHFKHHKELLEALLHDWEVRNYFEIAQIQARWSRAVPDLSEVVAIWLAEDPAFPAFDMAVRMWSRKSSSVSEAVHRVDDAWVTLLKELFLRSGYDATESFVRARIVYFHQIGYYAIAIREDWNERLRLVPFYYKALTGTEPGESLRNVLEAVAGKPNVEPSKRKRSSS